MTRNSIVFAATGAVGSAVARRLAAQGDRVWITGRRSAALADLKEEILGSGGLVETEILDATDEEGVERFVARLAARLASSQERVDAGFNAIGITPVEGGYPARMLDVDMARFFAPLDRILKSNFITTRALGRAMCSQRQGAIVMVTTALAGSQMPWMSGLTATSAAIEGLTRTVAAEFGPFGVRVNCVRADAMPETPSIGRTAASAEANGITREEFGRYVGLSLLGRPNSARQTAAMIAFLLSDAAESVTYQTFNSAARPLA